ncbi:hypothetical protein D3C76_984600 [compost metagenome]
MRDSVILGQVMKYQAWPHGHQLPSVSNHEQLGVLRQYMTQTIHGEDVHHARLVDHQDERLVQFTLISGVQKAGKRACGPPSCFPHSLSCSPCNSHLNDR